MKPSTQIDNDIAIQVCGYNRLHSSLFYEIMEDVKNEMLLKIRSALSVYP